MQSGIYKYEPLWGEWKIEGLIGKGSYGEVYKIYKIDNGHRIEAAAKYISIPKSEQDKELAYSKGLATDEDSLRSFFETRANAFSKEIELMMKMRGSENVVRYEAHLKQEKKDDIGWDLIIRMELLTALEKYLKENSFTQKNVIQLGVDICNAIESCQKEKIIHRDVKIENIFIDEKGTFKLGDFGVSREAQGTTMGTITGTEDYMAPEIMKHEKYNNNVDIYSIGVVMYRLLNNNRIPFLPSDGPINDNDISLALTKRLEGSEEIPDPKFASGRLAEIIKKACAYDRHERYSSPSEMAHDLLEILNSAQDIEVLKPRKKTTSTKTDRTMSDVPVTNTGGSTVSEFGSSGSIGGTISEINNEAGTYSSGSGSGTMSDIGGPVPQKVKSKAPLFVGIGAICAVLLLVIILLIPRGVPLERIEGLPEDAVQMVVGDIHSLEYEVYPENTTAEITYKSSDDEILTVDLLGQITAISVGEGTVEIYVDEELYDTVLVNIAEEKVPVTDIQGIESQATLEIGGSITIYGQVVPSNATIQQVNYSSSNTSVATIGQDGVITGVSAGQTDITVSADGVTKVMKLTVKAKPQENKKVVTPSTKKPQQQQNNYTPPVQQAPVVDNTPASNAGNSNNAGGGNTNTETKPSKQYEAGDLSAFQ